MKRHRWKLVLLALALVFLIGAAALFKLMVRVGNIKYLYNYMHNTAGGLPTEYSLENAFGANLVIAQAVSGTEPSELSITEKISVNGIESTKYERSEPIYFDNTILSNFSNLPGLLTFRGNYMRSAPVYGTVELKEKKFNRNYWSYKTGKVLKSNGVDYWSGNGWTGQPIVVQWDEETKQIMNLYEESKKKRNLIEVIYPGMDGMIHFLDFETGNPTRDAINVGMTFKGTASLHPDGIPMLICGSGDAQTGPYGECISPRVYIYSLIDGSKLYEFGANDSFAPRIWHAYDSSPIFHTPTDTLIYPGENGVLYTLKLNTTYNKASKTLTVAPSEIVNYTFTEKKYDEDKRYGSECSGAVWGNYIFLGDNGGTIFCIDLNTMKMIWAQEVKEDVNSSPILEIDKDGNKYLYVATTLKFEIGSHSMGQAAIYKLNAMTGAIIWKKPYEVHTVSGLAGGILSTGILGNGSISGTILYSVSKTPSIGSGYLVSLDTKTGEVIWERKLDTYSWSSGGVIYPENGGAYLIQGCQNGDLLLIDAQTGEVVDQMNFGTGIEATPAIFGNRLVVGTRNEQIIGVEIK